MQPSGRDSGFTFRVPVARWSAWPGPGADSAGAPRIELSFVDAMLRRRLSPLARMTLHVAGDCAHEPGPLRLVFASRHGELNRTMTMLRDLAQAAPLSPTAFSLSVHNTAAGIFSIAREDRSPATAIAAGDETLGYALLEASCQFEAAPDRPVLVVYGDEPLPDEYRAFADGPETPHAVAVLLAANAGRSVTVAAAAAGGTPRSPALQSLAFIECLARERPGGWTGARHAWTWH